MGPILLYTVVPTRDHDAGDARGGAGVGCELPSRCECKERVAQNERGMERGHMRGEKEKHKSV